jgi:fructose-bisphosphate aldolase class II
VAVHTLSDILAPAFEQRYGVPAINIVNDLTMESVLAGAVEARSPVILQTSVKTVRAVGTKTLYAMWHAMTAGIEVPCALHLDHCPDRQVISDCLAAGWNSVLFDASNLPVEENQRQTVEVVAEARRYGADVEGEIESITGQEDGVGSDEESRRQTLDVQLRYLEATQVDVFAPAIGNAHGTYKAAPHLDSQRVTDIVEATGIPVALHGGTGMSPEQFTDLIARGCAKVNISTALKIAFMKAGFDFLTENPGKYDPPSQMKVQRAAVKAMAEDHIRMFGSAGKAW